MLRLTFAATCFLVFSACAAEKGESEPSGAKSLTEAADGRVEESAQDVRAAVRRFGEAYVEADVAILESLLTHDYLHVNGNSGNVLTREEWLDWIASRREEIENGSLVVTKYVVDDVRVEIYGTAAVVTGTVDASGIRNEERFASRVRFTNLWVRSNRIWRRAAFHDSALP